MAVENKRHIQFHLLTCVYLSISAGVLIALTLWPRNQDMDFYLGDSYISISSFGIFLLRAAIALVIWISTAFVFESWVRKRVKKNL